MRYARQRLNVSFHQRVSNTMADSDTTMDQQPKKQRLSRSQANTLCVRKKYYNTDEKQEKLRERIEILYQTKTEVERKIADLEKFLRTDSPGSE